MNGHLCRPKITGHEDHRPREIDLAVISERKSGFVEDSEQEIPECIACLLNFVEQQNAELHVIRMMPIEHLLAQ